MANQKSYYFLNLHLFSSIRIFIFILFCINVILFVFNVWHIAAFLIPTAIFLTYVCLHFGAIKIRNNNFIKNITIKSIFQNASLECPIVYERWWSYAINDGINVYGSLTSGKARSTANDIWVILKCTDAHGHEIYFQELIELDSRFPNKVEYFDIPISVKEKVIKVQRVDKVFELLQIQLAKEEFSEKANTLNINTSV